MVCSMMKEPRPKACMAWPAHFRLQASTCLVLAAKATEHWVAASLTELAEEFLDRAVRAELSISAERACRFHQQRGRRR
jgi:hypothetical protein